MGLVTHTITFDEDSDHDCIACGRPVESAQGSTYHIEPDFAVRVPIGLGDPGLGDPGDVYTRDGFLCDECEYEIAMTCVRIRCRVGGL